jgi:hypothetical protein
VESAEDAVALWILAGSLKAAPIAAVGGSPCCAGFARPTPGSRNHDSVNVSLEGQPSEFFRLHLTAQHASKRWVCFVSMAHRIVLARARHATA